MMHAVVESMHLNTNVIYYTDNILCFWLDLTKYVQFKCLLQMLPTIGKKIMKS